MSFSRPYIVRPAAARPVLAKVRRLGLAAAAVAIGTGFLGAGTWEWSFTPKGDREAMAIDCRGPVSARAACEEALRPAFATATSDETPGVSTVMRVAR
ncbi:hypothetical protein [Methylobrevis pamukkalensis]|uniref:Uncharacterized protein n=1 Tax=Methylobrevis pamukkalensis TaxID=1439726 RepID=A0A1E3GXY0_9HYPH|nr:hypothetical protein [Methylobrevis pamukkalensis]ODN68893.1 hypothetical protein A6302_03818 [Methylobrevis pamukkalensis]